MSLLSSYAIGRYLGELITVFLPGFFLMWWLMRAFKISKKLKDAALITLLIFGLHLLFYSILGWVMPFAETAVQVFFISLILRLFSLFLVVFYVLNKYSKINLDKSLAISVIFTLVVQLIVFLLEAFVAVMRFI